MVDSMKNIILLIASLSFASQVNAGFETKQEQIEKKKSEKNEEANKYISSLVGKTAWYNSKSCNVSNPIFANPDLTSDEDAKYNTEVKYVPVKFLRGEIKQTYFYGSYFNNYTLEVQIDNKEKGYLKSSDGAGKIELNDWGCFRTSNPENEDKLLNQKISTSSSIWLISCKKDPIDSKKTCFMTKDKLTVMLINGKYGIGVGKNHYPHSESAIKVDDNVAYYGQNGIINPMYTNLIINQLKKGKKASIRYQEWPYKYDIHGEIDLNGFTQNYMEMLSRFKRL